MDALSITNAFLIYFVAVNGATLLFSFYDKMAAMNFWPRASESFLLFLAMIGGAPAAKLVQTLTGHKSLRQDFTINLNLIVVFHLLLGVAAWSAQSPLLKELDLKEIKQTAAPTEARAKPEALPRRFGPGS